MDRKLNHGDEPAFLVARTPSYLEIDGRLSSLYDSVNIGSPPPELDRIPIFSALRKDHPDLLGDQTSSFVMKGEDCLLRPAEFPGGGGSG